MCTQHQGEYFLRQRLQLHTCAVFPCWSPKISDIIYVPHVCDGPHLLVLMSSTMLTAVPGVLEPISALVPFIRLLPPDLLLPPPVILHVPLVLPLLPWRARPVAIVHHVSKCWTGVVSVFLEEVQCLALPASQLLLPCRFVVANTQDASPVFTSRRRLLPASLSLHQQWFTGAQPSQTGCPASSL